MMKSKFLLAILVIAMLLASGCVSVIKTPGDDASDDSIATELDEIDELVDEMEDLDEEEVDEVEEVDETDEGLPTKTVLEGEKVSFPNLKAIDPDGDPIIYVFSAPLDKDGEWETEKGDAGRYKVTITASDGTSEVAQDVVIIVKSLNKAPVLKQLEDIEIDEGDTVLLNPVATDADKDDIEISYSGWMTSSKKKTGYNDAGTHKVTVTASDGKDSVKQTITVKVANVNRAPTIDALEDVSVDEGDDVAIEVDASDPDGDDVEVSFSEPLDEGGEWQTVIGDAGKYMVKVTVSDGELDVEDTFYVTVKSTNAAPELEGVADVEVDEGDKISLGITATDTEGDEVTITFSAPFSNNGIWQTNFGDAGEYVVTVTASDGTSKTKETFEVTVNDVNRPPVFSEGAFD